MWRRLGAAVIAVPLALRTLASRRLRSVRCALLSRWWRLLPDTQLPAPEDVVAGDLPQVVEAG